MTEGVLRQTIEPGDAVLWREHPRRIMGDLRRGIAREIDGERVSVEFRNCRQWLPLSSLERMPSIEEAYGDKPEGIYDDDWYVGPVDEGVISEWPMP